MRIDFEAELEGVNVDEGEAFGEVWMDFVSLNGGSIQLTSNERYETYLGGNELSGCFCSPITIFDFEAEADEGEEKLEDEYIPEQLCEMIANADLYSFVVNATPKGEGLLKGAKIAKAEVTYHIDRYEFTQKSMNVELEINF